MKFKYCLIFVVFTLITITAYSQIDSLENRKIYTWNLNPHDHSLELVKLDTTLESFQNFNPLLKKTIAPNYLGNLGTAAQPRIYYDRRKYKTGFLFSEPYAMYFHLPKNQFYFNTKSPFTLVNYSTGGPKEESEQVLGVLHTRNVNKDFNYGFDYDMISSDGRYLNQEVKINSVTIFSSYRKKGYRLHANIGLDNVKAQENGGIDSLHYVGDSNYKNRRNIPVRLDDAGTKLNNSHIYLVQEYSFGRTIHEVKVRNKVNSNTPFNLRKPKQQSNISKSTDSQNSTILDSLNVNDGHRYSTVVDSIDIASNLTSDDSTSINIGLDTLQVSNYITNNSDSIFIDIADIDSNINIESTYLFEDSDSLKAYNHESQNDSLALDSTETFRHNIGSTYENEGSDTLILNNFSSQNDSIISDSTDIGADPIIGSTNIDEDYDTLNVFKSSGFSISHELYYSKDRRKFFDDNIEEAFYDNKDFFIDSTITNEEAVQKRLFNKFSLNYKYSNKFSVQFSFSNEQLKYQYDVRPDTLSIDTIIAPTIDTTVSYTIKSNTKDQFSNNKVAFYLKSLIFNKVLFKGYGEYYLTGYKKEDSKLDLKFAYILWKDIELSLEGEYSNKRPNYFYKNYTSNNFSWDKDYLRKIEEWDYGFALRSNKYRFEAKVSYGQISNYVYLDTLAYVNQYRGQINLMVGELSKHLKLGPIHSDTRFVYQKTSNDSILSLPEYSLYQSLYFERLSQYASTGGKMLWQFGLDYRFVSSYAADGYMPPLGLFYRQFNHVLANYHRFDLFLNLNIKRARVYLKYSLLNSAINKHYYFSGPYYPEPEPIFKFGLAWTFYD